jgi:hypothetical protein
MITRSDIFNKVSWFLKKENKFFSSSDVLTIINRDAFRQIAKEVMYPRTTYSGYLTSGSYNISTPVDFIKVDSNANVVFQDGAGTRDLYPKDKHEIGLAEIYTATPGVPGQYYMENESKIGIYPPCTSGNFVIPYVKRPTDLSSDSDTNELTERCYMAAVYWTVGECMLTDSDERFQGFRQLYDKEIRDLKDQYRRMLEIPKDIRPNRRYTR